MKQLLKKEFLLSVHPASYLFLLLSPMLLIPNYPYYVVFFYTSLGVFFTCLNGRENNDVFYSAMLPIAKRDIVKAHFVSTIFMEAAQFLTAVPFAVIRQKMPIPGNQAGMDANIALFGLSLAMMGLFNLLFFCLYYASITKVGKAFGIASFGIALYMLAAETCDHVVPFFRDCLDTPDPQFLAEKLTVLLFGLLCFFLCTAAAYRKSVRSFGALDL